jgi:hypothetical protein
MSLLSLGILLGEAIDWAQPLTSQKRLSYLLTTLLSTKDSSPEKQGGHLRACSLSSNQMTQK